MDPKERGTKFIDDFVAYYPEEIREELKARLLAQESGVIYAGESASRQEDYSKNMNEVGDQKKANQKWHDDLASWKSGIDKELEEGRAAQERLKVLDASGGGTINPDGTRGAGTGGDGGDGGDGGNGNNGQPDLTGYVKKEDVDRMISEATANAGANAFTQAAYMATLTANHMREFDEVLDTSALITHCRENNVRVDQGGYESFVKPRRDETAKKKHEEELKAAEERGRAAGRAEHMDAPPYPISSGQGGEPAGTLSGLKLDKDAKQGAVARAVQTYNEERKQHAGGS